jgi:nuclear cap-binding protein subunit 1
MKQVPRPIDGEEEAHNPLAIEIFAQTLFLLGSKTLTHAHSAISKYQALFRLLVDNEEGQLCVLKSAFDVWKQDSQMLSVVVDMLLKYQIVECGAVANWVFIKEMQPEFMRIYLWEILHMTIRKMSKHNLRLQKELTESREKLRRAEMNSSDSEAEGDEDGAEAKRKDPKDTPTEEQVDKMEEKLESAQAVQKNLFLIVFQRFIMILSEHIARCDTDGKNFNTPWYRWTIGRLQEVFMQHADQVALYSSTLETLLFTQDLDKNILEIFEQFKSLRA